MTSDRLLAVLARHDVGLTPAELDRVLTGKVNRLLTAQNPKTLKGEKRGYRTAILHLAPALASGFNVCASSTAGCIAACLHTAGRGGFDPAVPLARIRRTLWFMARRADFLARLEAEIASHVRRCETDGYIPCVRLNGTSDIRWESHGIVDAFPRVQFYDYTKHANRRDLPRNYHLTRSASEKTTAEDVLASIDSGLNVAMVIGSRDLLSRSATLQGQAQRMRRMTLPREWQGVPVVDGDESDLRFRDPQGVIVGLRAKGEAVADRSGFVRWV